MVCIARYVFISYGDMWMVSYRFGMRVLYSIYRYMMLSYGLGDACISYSDVFVFELRCWSGCIALGDASCALCVYMFAYGDACSVMCLCVGAR